jgi:hypothetical protein
LTTAPSTSAVFAPIFTGRLARACAVRQIFPYSNGIFGPTFPTTLGKRQPLMISLPHVPLGLPQRGSVASSSYGERPDIRCSE